MTNCRKCGILLQVGVNITEYGIRKSKFICKQCRSKYQKEWCRKNREKWNIYQKEEKKAAYQQLTEKLGSKCQICKADLTKKRWLHAHEIHGRPHNSSPRFILKHLKDFVLLCPKCHRGTHFCMTYLGLTWKEIEKIIINIYKRR